jgi:hypothetical protein
MWLQPPQGGPSSPESPWWAVAVLILLVALIFLFVWAVQD